jgi:hypothetical protein
MSDPKLVPDPKLIPSPEGTQPINIRPGSAMAVVGVFVEVIRKRFTKASQLPYLWEEDIKKTSLAIESAFNEDAQQRNFRAAIYVDRDEQVLGRTVIGDMVGQDLKSGLKAFWALETVPILIECIAAKKAESAILADIAGIFLHASSDLIQAKFGFHEMSPISMGRTQPALRDKQQWATPISFTVQYGVRWTNTPTAPLLQEIEASIARSDTDNATEYFETIALTTSGKATEET